MEEPRLSGPVVALLGRYVNKNHSGLVLQERLGLTDHAPPPPSVVTGVFSLPATGGKSLLIASHLWAS